MRLVMRTTISLLLLLFAASSCALATELSEATGSEFWPTIFGFKIKISDSLLVLFTMVLAMFTGLLWSSTNKLWRAGERQAVLTKQALISSQRAWISVSLRADGDFEIGRGDAWLAVSLTVHNIGNTPALRAHTIMEMVPHSDKIPDQLKRLCAGQLEPNETWSRLVLPNESYERKWAPSLGDRSIPEVKGAFWPHIIGCVSYQVVGDETVHQTAFVYGVTLGQNDEFSGFIPYAEGLTPKDSLVIQVQTGGFAT